MKKKWLMLIHKMDMDGIIIKMKLKMKILNYDLLVY